MSASIGGVDLSSCASRATRTIGVSNFDQLHIEELLAAGLPSPDAYQIEPHPLSKERQLVDHLRDDSIRVIAFGSLAPLSTWRAAAGQ